MSTYNANRSDNVKGGMLMLKLRHINPMVRAIGTMGAVAALVGGVTFAQQTSNTVMLWGYGAGYDNRYRHEY